jgi:hypothetical protein
MFIIPITDVTIHNGSSPVDLVSRILDCSVIGSCSTVEEMGFLGDWVSSLVQNSKHKRNQVRILGLVTALVVWNLWGAFCSSGGCWPAVRMLSLVISLLRSPHNQIANVDSLPRPVISGGLHRAGCLGGLQFAWICMKCVVVGVVFLIKRIS